MNTVRSDELPIFGDKRRIVLVIGMLNGKTSTLPRVLADADSTVIQFSSPEHWRDAINGVDVGAFVISRTLNETLRKGIISEIQVSYPSAAVVQI